MSPILVLDANILIRATLGNKVKKFLVDFNGIVEFFTPDSCVEEIQKYLPLLFEKRNMPPDLAFEVFDSLLNFIQVIDEGFYKEHEIEAQKRIRDRDPRDWPVVATALLFNCPIWTEDKDFFGLGIPLWTTDRIHLYFDSMK
jgi:predicted nucleic acid-binding protein